MSKKRKTRKEKESTQRRKEHIHIQVDSPVYSINKADIEHKIENQAIKEESRETEHKITTSNFSKATSKVEKSYLIHDIQLILGASGIVIAFDIVLFLLLSKGILKLPLFGY